jgi:NADH-quinone oxidoreductase subunit N
VTLTLSALIPEGILLGLLLISLTAEAIQKDKARRILWPLTGIGIFLALASVALTGGKRFFAFGGMFVSDPLAQFFKIILSVSALTVLWISKKFFEARSERSSEFFLTLLAALLGMFFLVSAHDTLLLFISLEIVAFSFYIMTAYLRRDLLSTEAAVKYLILGSLSSAFLIYGISLIYATCGSTAFGAIRAAFESGPRNLTMQLGLLLIISGIGFKIAAVPFQLWVPDVYQGAPTPVTAFLITASKTAGMALFVRLLDGVFPSWAHERTVLFSALAALTLIYGNFAALLQTNIKRLWGYSSIGHAGYLLMGLASGPTLGTPAVLYYLIAYVVTNLAALFVIMLVGKTTGSEEIKTYRGLAKRSPVLAAALFVALLSLAGVPPLAGFFAKFLVLLAAVRSHLEWLALLGALIAAVSLFYYLSIVRMMYLEEPESAEPIAPGKPVEIFLLILIAAIILMGFYQAPFFGLALRSAV